jgi:hypothetical protein
LNGEKKEVKDVLEGARNDTREDVLEGARNGTREEMHCTWDHCAKRARITSTPTLIQSLPVTARHTRIKLTTLGLGGITDMNSRAIAPAQKHLSLGLVSHLAPLWLPAAQRLGQVVWIAGSKCAGFEVSGATSIHSEITPDLLGSLLDKSLADMVFYEGWPHPPAMRFGLVPK